MQFISGAAEGGEDGVMENNIDPFLWTAKCTFTLYLFFWRKIENQVRTHTDKAKT